MNYNKPVKVYTFTVPANGAFPLLVISDYFRLQSATGAVDVSGDTFGTLPDLLTGQGLENTPYNRLVFTDKTGAPNTVSVLCSGDLFIDNRTYGVNSLDAATIASLKKPDPYTAAATLATALTANVAECYLLPANNVAGAVVQFFEYVTTSTVFTMTGALLAKSSAPANVTDGDPMALLKDTVQNVSGGTALQTYHHASLLSDVLVPAGKGIYWIQDAGTSAGLLRGYRIRVL